MNIKLKLCKTCKGKYAKYKKAWRKERILKKLNKKSK